MTAKSQVNNQAARERGGENKEADVLCECEKASRFGYWQTAEYAPCPTRSLFPTGSASVTVIFQQCPLKEAVAPDSLNQYAALKKIHKHTFPTPLLPWVENLF